MSCTSHILIQKNIKRTVLVSNQSNKYVLFVDIKESRSTWNFSFSYHHQLLKALNWKKVACTCNTDSRIHYIIFPHICISLKAYVFSVVGWKTNNLRKPHRCKSNSKIIDSATCPKSVIQNTIPASSLVQVFIFNVLVLFPGMYMKACNMSNQAEKKKEKKRLRTSQVHSLDKSCFQ